MSVANVFISDMDFDLPAIAEAAGESNVDKRWVLDDRLYVEGVTQDALDAALAAWDQPAYVLRRASDKLRADRNERLAASDWTQFSDVVLDNKAAWATYRQALRDLPANTADPANPTWPTKPGD